MTPQQAQDTLNAILLDAQKAASDYQARVDSINLSIGALNNTITQVLTSGAVGDLQNQLNTANGTISTLQGQISGLNNQISSLQNTITSDNTEISTLQNLLTINNIPLPAPLPPTQVPLT